MEASKARDAMGRSLSGMGTGGREGPAAGIQVERAAGVRAMGWMEGDRRRIHAVGRARGVPVGEALYRRRGLDVTARARRSREVLFTRGSSQIFDPRIRVYGLARLVRALTLRAVIARELIAVAGGRSVDDLTSYSQPPY